MVYFYGIFAKFNWKLKKHFYDILALDDLQKITYIA